MEVKNGIRSQGDVCCRRDLPESGEEMLRWKALLADGAGTPPHPAGWHTDSCCLDPGSDQPLEDVQLWENTGNPTPFGKDAANPETDAEKAPSVGDDSDDDDLEYFECSDVLTPHEEELWRRKLKFLLESDDEDELKLSRDCDGCAYFLGETPGAPRVSGDTRPGETPIGFWGHHSTFRGVDVRRDPSLDRQPTVQPDMTLAVGQHRETDKERSDAPVASPAAGNRHPPGPEGSSAGSSAPGGTDGGSSAPRGTDGGSSARQTHPGPADAEPAGATGAPGTTPEEEGGGNVAEENSTCTLTASLKRNLLRLLNPLELCRYVSSVGQSLQAACAASPGREGGFSSRIPGETESLEALAEPGRAEEAEKDNPWERERTQGLCEQDGNASLGDHGVNLQGVAQGCEELEAEPEAEGIFRARERRESCHQGASSGQETISNGHKPEDGVSAVPFGAAAAKQACLCAVLSSAKLGDGDEPRGAEQRVTHGGGDPEILCGLSGDEPAFTAHPQPGVESGEPGEPGDQGDADLSAVHHQLWQLLHQDDSECPVPFANRGVTSFPASPARPGVPEPSCWDQPLPTDVMEEQEPLMEPVHDPSTGEAACSAPLLQGASQGEVGTRMDPNRREAPTLCPPANNVLLEPGECSKPDPTGVDSSESTVAWEGKLPGNNSSQSFEAGCPRRESGADLTRPEANPDVWDKIPGTAGHPEGSSSWLGESVPGEGCFRDRGGLAVHTVAKPEGAFPPSAEELLLIDFDLEVPSCEPGETDRERESPCGSGVRQVSGSQAAVCPHYPAEQDGEFQMDSSSCASPSGTSAPSERRGTAEQEGGSQQLPGMETPLFLTPGGHSEGLLPSSPALECPGTGSQVESGSTPAGDKGNRDLSVLETSCGASGMFQEGERARCGNEQESPGAIKGSPEGTLMSCQAQVVPPSTEQPRPDEADRSAEPPEREKLRPAERASGNFPPAGSGSGLCSPEQPPRSRTQPSSGKGAKKKLPPASLSKKPRLEEKDPKKAGKGEAGGARKEDRKAEQRKLGLKKDSKAPRLLKKIQAEPFPERSGDVKLCCQFGDIHGDSAVTWTKDSKVLARLHRSAQDDSPVSLEIPKAGHKDQGMYYCCLNNTYGKVTAEFHLTSAVLERLSSCQSYEGVEEIEFMQLQFREADAPGDGYFGGRLRGELATEARHFGEGMHRRAFRSRVCRGLAPLFAPGHACVLKVHSALAHGAASREELLRRNYDLALQECCVQNAAREYAKRYAAETEMLEGFGEVPEIIPIFLIHRPANHIPYATVEEELVGEFVKYSIKDGKEVNVLRRDSEAGQKCCTFQHWVYERTGGNLLVTDLQGVGMKLTDVGIATLAKGYKGLKGNCSFSFIEQFRALHQCNRYCEMLGLKPLRAAHPKPRRAPAARGKNPPGAAAAKRPAPKKGREHRDLLSSQH